MYEKRFATPCDALAGRRMSEQLPLPYCDDLYEALAATVMAIGGFKRVGAALRPELPIEQAGRWLSDCCNPQRDHELKPAHLAMIRKLAREAGVHLLAHFEAHEAGYAEPVPVEPEDQVADLQRQFLTGAESLKAMLARIERLQPAIGRKRG